MRALLRGSRCACPSGLFSPLSSSKSSIRSLPLKRLSTLPIKASLATHLDLLAERHKQLECELEDSATVFSADRMRELSTLSPIVAAHAELNKLVAEVVELRELANDTSVEAELRVMADSELGVCIKRLTSLESEIIALLVPPEEDSEHGAVLEIRAGTGGLEAGLFASELLIMYERFARRRQWRFQILDQSLNDAGGTREATASVTGIGVYGALRTENGVHRVQRVPATEGLGRVHTSTAVVVVLPAAEDGGDGVELRAEDIDVDVFRAGGAGGQHVNTTESAVRLTHRPTGIKVSCQNERSQHMNKATAMKVLRARVEDHERQRTQDERDSLRATVASTGARSERIRTYNFADDRITDHRLNESKFGLPRMLDGDLLGEFVDELAFQASIRRRERFIAGLEG